MAGYSASRLTLGLAVKVGRLLNDVVLKEVEEWAEDNRVDATGRSKLRAIKVTAKKAIDALEEDVLGAFDEIIKGQDRTIELLRAEVAELGGGADERNALRREVKAMLEWLLDTEYSIMKAAEKMDPGSHPNRHPPTSIHLWLEEPPEPKELATRAFREPLNELKRFVHATHSFPTEAARIRIEVAQFPERKCAIVSGLKKVNDDKRLGVSFPED